MSDANRCEQLCNVGYACRDQQLGNTVQLAWDHARLHVTNANWQLFVVTKLVAVLGQNEIVVQKALDTHDKFLIKNAPSLSRGLGLSTASTTLANYTLANSFRKHQTWLLA
jgi:hypothetical protein